jgi:hypothetical protein
MFFINDWVSPHKLIILKSQTLPLARHKSLPPDTGLNHKICSLDHSAESMLQFCKY